MFSVAVGLVYLAACGGGSDPVAEPPTRAAPTEVASNVDGPTDTAQNRPSPSPLEAPRRTTEPLPTADKPGAPERTSPPKRLLEADVPSRAESPAYALHYEQLKVGGKNVPKTSKHRFDAEEFALLKRASAGPHRCITRDRALPDEIHFRVTIQPGEASQPGDTYAAPASVEVTSPDLDASHLRCMERGFGLGRFRVSGKTIVARGVSLRV